MIKGFIGIKQGMTQGFDTHGRWVPITVVKAPKNVIYQLKNKETDKYVAAQIGLPGKKTVNKPLLGLSKKLNVEAPKMLKEVEYTGDVKVGAEVSVKDVLRKGELVDVKGVSKGKGFAGGMKRHGFHGGPRTHGQSDRSRAPGSIGSGTTPGRVYKGKRMAGHMGVDNVTVKGLEVLEVNDKEELVMVKGAIPGPNQGLVVLVKTGKRTKAYVEPEIPAMPVAEAEESSEGSEDTTEAQAPAAEAAGAPEADNNEGN